MRELAQLLRKLANRLDPPRRGIPVADRGDTLVDWDDESSWGENPL